MGEDILAGLTAQQLEAVTHRDGPMLVVAGAGSGKTRVVTRRIAWLIGQGVKPWQILAMTFTNKAAGEMRERIAHLVGEAPRWMGTFHSLCARFLRFDIEKLNIGLDRSFTIYDSDDQLSVLKKIMKDQGVDDKRFKPRTIASAISKAKSEMKGPQDMPGGSWQDDVVARAYKTYETRLRGNNALDFDDLLLLTARLLERNPEMREEYRRKFAYLLIDEYQDTNHTQYRLMKLLCNAQNNVHVTGDPDQSIYSWRGADYRNIMDFQTDFPGARVVRLERNYRSTKAILASANAVIKNNSERIEKNLYTEEEDGEPVRIFTLDSDREEAAWIARQAAKMKTGGLNYSQMAVLYRTNAQSRVLEEALMSSGIPYQIVGGVRFYERKEIKDILAHLKILVNPRDTVSLARVVACRPTGVGEKTLAGILEQAEIEGVPPFELLAREDFANTFSGRSSAKLRDFSYWCRRLSRVERAPLRECVKQVLEVSGLIEHISANSKDPAWEDRLENLEAFMGRAAEFGLSRPEAGLGEFLEDVALVADVDTYDPNADNLVLMTLHSAKGLEFPAVFLAGLENGLLPHSNSAEQPAGMEEERRLFYVGITRAQRNLYITRARTRMLWGNLDYAQPSPFLLELPPEQIEEDAAPTGRTAAVMPEDADDLDGIDDDFDLGDEVDDPFIDDILPTRPAIPPKRTGRPAIRTITSVDRPPFRSGDHVKHPSFGQGKVLSCSRSQAVVQFFTGGTKLLALSSANLQKA